MVFRLLLLVVLVGILAMFFLQNLSPVLPLVFFGIRFPALPLSWWVLGAIAAGGGSMLAIQILFGLSNFVTRQRVRSQSRPSPPGDSSPGWSPPWANQNSVDRTAQVNYRRDRTSTTSDDSWQDWRRSEATSTQPASQPSRNFADDWERPLSDDWENTTPDAPRDRTQDQPAATESKRFETQRSSQRTDRADSTYAYSYRQPQNTGAGKPEPVVDVDYRVIVPPYRPLDAPIPAPTPPPAAEENADDWFEDPSGESKEPSR